MKKKEENKVAKGFCLISEEINSLREESERLKALIEKMKCCGNCKHWIVKLGFDSKCELKEPCEFGKRDKWECIE